MLIRFVENEHTDTSVEEDILVSKKYLDSIYKKHDSIKYLDFLCSKNGYVFFTALRFSCILGNLPNKSQALKNPFYTNLEKHLMKAEKDIAVHYDVTIDTQKKYMGWVYTEVQATKFLLCLISGKIFRKCQPIEGIAIENMDNLYFRVLVPITW